MHDLRSILDNIDQSLLVYLDDEDHLSIPAAERALGWTERLLTGEVSFGRLAEEWPDWYGIVEAFVLGYGLEELEELFGNAPLGGLGLDEPVSAADRAFLDELGNWLSLHIDQRRNGETL